MATKFEVMHLQLLHAAADLAPPVIAFQHLPVQFSIVVRIKSESRGFGTNLLHEAFRATSDRKVSRCGLGRNL